MEEIRKNQTVQLELRNGDKIEGIVFNYSKDRADILISFDSLDLAKKLKELDVVLAIVKTHIGTKKMFSHVINELNENNYITIENSDVLPSIQRREFVRVLSNLVFQIINEQDKIINCSALNISGGGIAFCAPDNNFKIDEKVEIILPEGEFENELKCCAKIIKIYHNSYVAKFENLTPAIEGKIIKYVFKLVAKK